MDSSDNIGKPGRPPRRSGGGSSAFKAWLLAIIAIGGCGALGYYYWQLREKHIEQKGQFEQAAERAEKYDQAQSRADKAETELTRVKADLDTRNAALTKMEEAQKFTAAELAQLREMKAQADARAAAFEKIKASFKEMIDSKVLEVQRREGRLIVRMPAEVLFPLGSADLSEKGQIELYKLSAILQKEEMKNKFKFMVSGHTDNTPIQAGPTSKYRNNWELSTARAVTVTELLIKAGISPKNLVAAGYGEHSPLVDNKSAGGKARNRRIEIVLLPDVDELSTLADDPKSKEEASKTPG